MSQPQDRQFSVEYLERLKRDWISHLQQSVAPATASATDNIRHEPTDADLRALPTRFAQTPSAGPSHQEKSVSPTTERISALLNRERSQYEQRDRDRYQAPLTSLPPAQDRTTSYTPTFAPIVNPPSTLGRTYNEPRVSGACLFQLHSSTKFVSFCIAAVPHSTSFFATEDRTSRDACERRTRRHTGAARGLTARETSATRTDEAGSYAIGTAGHCWFTVRYIFVYLCFMLFLSLLLHHSYALCITVSY